MPIDPDSPVLLTLSQLESNPGWGLILQRLDATIERRRAEVEALKPTAPPEEYQRLLGQIEGLRYLKQEPKRIESEWKAAHAAREKAIKRANPT